MMNSSQTAKELELPKNKLSAVTRKRNDINKMISTCGNDKQQVLNEVEILKVKISNFETSCQEELQRVLNNPDAIQRLQTWYQENLKDMKDHVEELKLWSENMPNGEQKSPARDLSRADDITPMQFDAIDLQEVTEEEAVLSHLESISQIGSNGNISTRNSAASSIRRAAELKLQVEADKLFHEHKKQLEELRRRKQRQQRLKELQLQDENEDEEVAYNNQLRELEFERLQYIAEGLKGDVKSHVSKVSGQSKSALDMVVDENRPLNRNTLPLKNSNPTPMLNVTGSPNPSPASNYWNVAPNNSAVSTQQLVSSDQQMRSSVLPVSDSLPNILLKQDKLAESFHNECEISRLPSHEPESFDGSDVTKFRSFMLEFEQQIARKCKHSSDKFYYLIKYTKGTPNELVKSCHEANYDLAYERAVQQLHKRYNNDFKVSSAYLKKLADWPVIKPEDGKSLQDFSFELIKCRNLLGTIPNLSQLNSDRELVNLAKKLPYKLREKWRNEAYHYLANLGEVSFSNFVDFVDKQACILNVPIFGDLCENRSVVTGNSKHASQSCKRVFSTNAFKPHFENRRSSEVSKPCKQCGHNNHSLDSCREFLGKSLKDRINAIRDWKLCFGCLGVGHSSKFCKARLVCKTCQKRHPSSLHQELGLKEDFSHASTSALDGSQEAVTRSEIPTSTCAATRPTEKELVRRIICAAIPVKVRVKGGQFVKTLMALDTQASACFIDESLVVLMRAEGMTAQLKLATMQGCSSVIEAKIICDIEISSLDDSYSSTLQRAYSKNDWPFSLEDSPKQEDIQNYSYLKEIPFTFLKEKIGILIGINRPDIIKPLKIIDGNENEPYASLHSFGWALNGPILSRSKRKIHCNRVNLAEVGDIEDKIEHIFNKDFVDYDGAVLGMSQEDIKWKDRVESSIRKTFDDHYEMGLPFKEEDVQLPNNYNQAYSRIMCLKARFKRNNELHEEYTKFMESTIEAGYAALVPKEETEISPGKSWYLVHHGVMHKQKKRLRVVFDCSLKYKDVSLNQKLLQGPDLTNNLLGVLLKFRQEKIAFMGDIEKMFYQVRVPKEDRTFLRFLWYPKGDYEQDPVQYQLSVHVFGAISSPSCANFALQSVAKDSPNISEEAKHTIENNFYVDDLAKSVPNEERAIDLINEVCRHLSKGGFKLTGFVSNSRKVLNALPPDKLSKGLKAIDLGSEELPQERVLGIIWKVQEDKLGFKVNSSNESMTRRGVLSTVFSLFDPLGISAPVTVPAKRIFQETCRRKLPWDEELPQDLKDRWKRWLNSAHFLNDYEIDIGYKGNLENIKSCQLHIFCDGSEAAYGAVAFLRFEGVSEVHCSFVLAKAHLTPLNNSTLRTIPRIELNAAKLATQIKQTLERELELKIPKTYLWSDSTTVLSYICNDSSRYQRFVANRVAYIRQHTSVESWRYVPGDINPADLVSRGCSFENFVKNENWKKGPQFLEEREEKWPQLPNLEEIPVDPTEIKGSPDQKVPKNKAFCTSQPQDFDTVNKLLTASSSWFKVKIWVAWLLRFKQVLRKVEPRKGAISLTELAEAEIEIWAFLQRVFYANQITKLEKGRNLDKNEPLARLNPQLIDGLLRVGGRQDKSKASFDVKHPIILPPKAYVTQLLIKNIHTEVGHLGRETVLSKLRQKYWIPNGNSVVRKIVSRCVVCKRIQGRPSEQLMSDLPEERLTSNLPVFTNTGVDYFGPIVVHRARSTAKRYGVVFTCLASRAIHLEVASSLDLDSFLLALRRFIARRGQVKRLRSDNGTNFVGSERELKKSIKDWNMAHLEGWCLQHCIDWKFHPPFSSHFGGIWEREIRTIKKVLNSLLKEQPIRLNDEALNTLFCEVEGILNNRPLTPLSNDPQDLEALTPNHLLLLNSETCFPPGNFDRNDLYSKRRWRQVQYLADLFWSRWKREYIPLLQERQKWVKVRRNHKVGDLVLVVDQMLPRNQWCLGKIVEVKTDSKGYVRSAKVKVSKCKVGKNVDVSTTILERPITKLILIIPMEDIC